MKPTDLILHCYVEKIDGQWQAFCLDLSLAAQGESASDVEHKLLNMIHEYVYDALVGQDKEHASKLLKRSAPLKYWMKFYFMVAFLKVGGLRDGMRHLFCPPMPLEPANYNHA